MSHTPIRNKILEQLVFLQNKGFSYQDICDFINQEQKDFVLFKDFFSHLRGKKNYYKGKAKSGKLNSIAKLVQLLYENNIDQEDLISETIMQRIQAALDVEFLQYSIVNRKQIQLKLLKEHYMNDSPAYLTIINNIKHKKLYGWMLDLQNYGSTYKILACTVQSVFQEDVVIQTNEYWKLYWIDKNTGKLEFPYECINSQTYLLTKDQDGTWKIKENIYTSDKNKKRPEYFEIGNLLDTDNTTKKREIINQILDDNDLAKAIAFIIHSYDFKISNAEKKRLEFYKTEYIALLRELNTGKLDNVSFEARMLKIKNKVKTNFQDFIG